MGDSLTPDTAGRSGVPVSSAGPDSPEQYTGVELWLRRAAVLLFVLFCASVGVILVVMPWTLAWTDNYFLTRFPTLRPVVTHDFVRGLCTGLGILDLWIGFSEAIHYHEEGHPKSNE